MTAGVRGNPVSVRAPRGNNLAAIAPERTAIADLLKDNRHFWESAEIPSWVRDLRASARRELGSVARHYAGSYLSGSLALERDLADDRPWIVGGHQPELFHPGVWFKNILIDRLAKETDSVGLHTIVDHDLLRAAAIRVPSRDDPRHVPHTTMVSLPLVRPPSPDPFLPWNAWRVDPSRIEDVCDQIHRSLDSVGIHRSMAVLFFHQLIHGDPKLDAAVALSQTRHRLERRHGIGNWELPMSHVCRTGAWRAFVDHCISNALELNRVYNACLEEYRSRQGITNPAQPVPALGRQGDWIELPFWVRLPGQLNRNRMWIHREGTRSRIGIEPNPDRVSVEADDRFWDSAWVVWPRALMTTLFLRVFVADLFVHGIGGGQYDRLTDSMIERFLHLNPPGFVTCTATLWLDFPDANPLMDDQLQVQSASLERERHRLRSAPEHFLDRSQPQGRSLWDQHHQLLHTMPPRGQKKAWHAAMRHLKTQMVSEVEPSRRDWEQRKHAIDARILENRVLQSREFSYVLFEESDILARLAKLAEC